jgi:VCBS repeat protein
MPVSFASPGPQLNYFGTDPNAGSWTSQNRNPRLLADINNDGKADIVGFADTGVFTSLALGNGGFGVQQFQQAMTLWGTTSGGWNEPGVSRQVADINSDGYADLVGFGPTGVLVSLNNKVGTNGTFASQAFVTDPEVNSFWSAQGGWNQDELPRFLAPVSGLGATDIVGFSEIGVFVSLNNGSGTFGDPGFAPGTEWWGEGPGTGNWVGTADKPAQDIRPRLLADVNGDNMDDLVGFGDSGIEVSLATGNGNFAPHTTVAGTSFWTPSFGWDQSLYPRVLADVNGDGLADIVGFGQPQNSGDTGVWASLNTSTLAVVSFAAQVQVASSFWTPAMGFTNDDTYPRQLADITGDAKADIVGFAQSAVWTSVSTST